MSDAPRKRPPRIKATSPRSCGPEPNILEQENRDGRFQEGRDPNGSAPWMERSFLVNSVFWLLLWFFTAALAWQIAVVLWTLPFWALLIIVTIFLVASLFMEEGA